MSPPKWVYLLIIVTFNVVFSFYYSAQIVKQNQLLNYNQNILNSLAQKNLELQQTLATLQSATSIDYYAQQQQLTPIKKIFQINSQSP